MHNSRTSTCHWISFHASDTNLSESCVWTKSENNHCLGKTFRPVWGEITEPLLSLNTTSRSYLNFVDQSPMQWSTDVPLIRGVKSNLFIELTLRLQRHRPHLSILKVGWSVTKYAWPNVSMVLLSNFVNWFSKLWEKRCSFSYESIYFVHFIGPYSVYRWQKTYQRDDHKTVWENLATNLALPCKNQF